MSSHSMKYHSLPTLSDLKAYRSGKLSNDDRSWIDSVVERNPLVAEVLRNVDTTNSTAVNRISLSVSETINKTYIPSRGFWSKYAGWIGLSSIVLILGVIYFLNQPSISAKYTAEKMALNVSSPESEGDVNLVSNDNDTGEVTKDLSEKDHSSDKGSKEEVKVNNDSSYNKLSSINLEIKDSELLETEKDQSNKRSNLILPENDESEKLNGENKQADNTRSFDNSESKEKTGNVLLAVNSVNIMSKSNPDDFKTRKKNSTGRDPLGGGATKRQNNASYSMGDMPSYPGGDQALINYFKGKLHPIEIPVEADKFDRSVLIELEVNARGKLKNHEIMGNLHPTHQKELEKAIEDLPQFDKGKGEKVKYSLAISF